MYCMICNALYYIMKNALRENFNLESSVMIELQMSVRIIRELPRRARETDQILLYERSFSHICIFAAKLVTDILEFQAV